MKKKTPTEYAKKGGIRCPYCNSDQLEGSSWDCCGGWATQEVGCLGCERGWVDHYKLVGYIATN